jgi:hypothetical protein
MCFFLFRQQGLFVCGMDDTLKSVRKKIPGLSEGAMWATLKPQEQWLFRATGT